MEIFLINLIRPLKFIIIMITIIIILINMTTNGNWYKNKFNNIPTEYDY